MKLAVPPLAMLDVGSVLEVRAHEECAQAEHNGEYVVVRLVDTDDRGWREYELERVPEARA